MSGKKIAVIAAIVAVLGGVGFVVYKATRPKRGSGSVPLKNSSQVQANIGGASGALAAGTRLVGTGADLLEVYRQQAASRDEDTADVDNEDYDDGTEPDDSDWNEPE